MTLNKVFPIKSLPVLFNLRFHACCRLSGLVYLRFTAAKERFRLRERERGLHMAIVDISPHRRASEKDASLPINSVSVYVRWPYAV